MSIWKAALLGVLIPAGLVLPAAAQQGPGRGPEMMFERFDLDGDGAITLTELQEAREGRFEAADANGDGLLDRPELLAMVEERAARGVDRMLQRADGNGDGALSAEELSAARSGRGGPDPERLFQRMDADGNAAISRAEFDEAIARLRERHGDRGDRGPGFGRNAPDRG